MSNVEVPNPILSSAFEEPKEHGWILEAQPAERRQGRTNLRFLPQTRLGKAVNYFQEYLTDVLRRLPAIKNTEVKDLVPSRWKPPAASGQVCLPRNRRIAPARRPDMLGS